jgi:hypothetical protein
VADLVNELADWLVPRAGLRSSAPFDLFTHAIEESAATPQHSPLYSVLTQYGGAPLPSTPVRTVALQVKTVGPVTIEAMARAQLLHDKLLQQRVGDDAATLVRNEALPSFFIFGIANLRPPGLVGRDGQRRAEVVFNFECIYRAL